MAAKIGHYLREEWTIKVNYLWHFLSIHVDFQLTEHNWTNFSEPFIINAKCAIWFPLHWICKWVMNFKKRFKVNSLNLITLKFYQHTHHWIARDEIYRNSSGSNSIRWSVRSEFHKMHFRANRWRALLISVFVRFGTNAPSDLDGSKSKHVQLIIIYRSVHVSPKYSKKCSTFLELKPKFC